MRKTLLLLVSALFFPAVMDASRLVEVRILDKDCLVVHFRDGEVCYRDDATGKSAYLGHTFVEGDDTLKTFLPRFSPASLEENWIIRSRDDKAFGQGKPATAAFRKSKPMNTDHTLTSELDHWIFLQLPASMKEGCTYEVEIPASSGSDRLVADIRFDSWNSPSEAIHVNILGYTPADQVKAADLYYWMGDGGPRDYSAFEGKPVYLYNPDTGKRREAGRVTFWKPQEASIKEAGRKDLTGSPVWTLDFSEETPGRYRLVVEGIGCSMDFVIDPQLYREPYRYSVRGYYYMRLGEPIAPEDVFPVPRQPRFVPGEDPVGFKVYLSDLQPWHPDWRKNPGDVWDEPHFKPAQASSFWKHRPEGFPVNDKVRGGHSDAMDWDRHLAHVSNIYDMLLPFLLTGGRLQEDDFGIRESGNGIPDLLDEARNEVDFFLSIRDPEGGYSQGVTNPDKDWTVMFQAGSTTMAAWANAANCAIMAEGFRVLGNDGLCRYYQEEAVTAFRFAEKQEWTQLDDRQGIGNWQMRGRDFRQMAAAFLYNLTGDRAWEDLAAADAQPSIVSAGWNGFCQFWGAVAYLTCPRERHYPELYASLVQEVDRMTDRNYLNPSYERPSRRSADDARWVTSENLQPMLLAHYLASDPQRRLALEQAMYREAGWGLGRNPGNIVEMTGLGQRHITDAYSTGRNDGAPGTHPGQTPFDGTETWSKGDGGDARILLDRCYPSWDTGGWPRQESYFNQRYLWVNEEFTPRETMRGKMALLAYLYGIRR
ncbi:MAG: glycoside hydrolase family 9 protein [Bacteroidales bacterium]|nr:glycoside hydrolase family 9 protein [Bacteroidales bacterium]